MSNKMVRISVPPEFLEELKKRQQSFSPPISISSLVRHYITLGLPIIRNYDYMYSNVGGEFLILKMPEQLLKKCDLIKQKTGTKSSSKVFFTAIVEGMKQADKIKQKEEGVL